jgi:DNA-binding transcriptional LysR family regulator
MAAVGSATRIRGGSLQRIRSDALRAEPMCRVCAGMGITLLPESLAKIKWPKVKFLRIHKDAPSADLHLFYRKDEQSPVVNKFVQMIKRR